MEIRPLDPERHRYWQWIGQEIDSAKERLDTAYLASWKREILKNYPDSSSRPYYVNLVLYRLNDVPDEVRCDCCGLLLRRHSYQRSGPDGILLTLGKECVRHELGACRRQKEAEET